MKHFALMVFFAVTIKVEAQTIPTEQAIELCRSEQNALRRLNCYDAITLKTQTLDTDKTAPVNAVVATKLDPVQTTQATTAENSFGMEHKKTKEQTPDRIYMTVDSVTENSQRELIVAFSNGQKWRQNGSGYYQISAGETHFIKRGILGSFFLGSDQNNRTIRVKREQ
jgi:hypothetical protein